MHVGDILRWSVPKCVGEPAKVAGARSLPLRQQTRLLRVQHDPQEYSQPREAPRQTRHAAHRRQWIQGQQFLYSVYPPSVCQGE